MNTRDCWRLTDNRHWDSPGRMSDGRIFTDWRTACTMNNEIAKRARMKSGLSHSFSEMLQQTHGAATYRNMEEAKAVTGDPWGRNYKPPPPKQLIVPVARQGVELLTQDLPDAIGTKVHSGEDGVRAVGPFSQGDVRVSDCGVPVMSLNDPRWGLSSGNMVLNLRGATPHGGSTTDWIRGTLGERV